MDQSRRYHDFYTLLCIIVVHGVQFKVPPLKHRVILSFYRSSSARADKIGSAKPNIRGWTTKTKEERERETVLELDRSLNIKQSYANRDKTGQDWLWTRSVCLGRGHSLLRFQFNPGKTVIEISHQASPRHLAPEISFANGTIIEK